MTGSRLFGLIHQQNSANCIAGLLLILILTGCGQTKEISGPQPGKTAAQAEFTGKSKSQPKDAQPQGPRFPYVPDEVLVKFKPEANTETITRILNKLKLETIHRYSSPNLFLMKITDGASVETTIKRLTNYKDVKYAEPNYGVKTTQ